MAPGRPDEGPTEPTGTPPATRVWCWAGGVVAVVVVAGIITSAGGKPSPPTAPAITRPVVGTTPVVSLPGDLPAAPAPVARPRLHVTGQDATLELVQLARDMTREEAVALGLGVLLTGTDTYAVKVRVANTGNTPVRVFPENVRVHYGGEAAGVTTVSHPGFLQRGVLQPNFYFEGLVLYRARVDIGAAIRLAGGGLSYADDTIEVTYDP